MSETQKLNAESTQEKNTSKQEYTETLQPDNYPLSADDPYAPHQQVLSEFILAAPESSYQIGKLLEQGKIEPAVAILNSPPRELVTWVLACLSRKIWPSKSENRWKVSSSLGELLKKLLGQPISFNQAEILTFFELATQEGPRGSSLIVEGSFSYIKVIEQSIKEHGLSSELRSALINWSDRPWLFQTSEFLSQLIGIRFQLDPEFEWIKSVETTLAMMEPDERAAWEEWINFVLRPSKWRKASLPLLAAIGEKKFQAQALSWLSTFNSSPPQRRIVPSTLEERWLDRLLCTLGQICDPHDPELVQIVAETAATGMQVVKGEGDGELYSYADRNSYFYNYQVVKNAVEILSRSERGAAYLLALQPRAESFTHRRMQRSGTSLIRAALDKASQHTDLSKVIRAEFTSPSFGMEQIGVLEQTLGEWTVTLHFESSRSPRWSYIHSSGKTNKTLPAAIKSGYPAELQELKKTASKISQALSSVRDQLENYRYARRAWTLDTWRKTYCDHPLTGVIARRLIWSFEKDGQCILGAWHDGALRGREDEQLELDNEYKVRLWHPIDSSPEEVLAWRSWFEEKQISQPFKQAHREIYLLTDAERRTRIYSNRFAAHILKQHQFKGLCLARNWKYSLKMTWDSGISNIASLSLPDHELEAEFWVQNVGDVYGVDTNDVGTFLYVSSDQVRFNCSRDTERRALPLESIPPLVFSEVMRDVDLFIGVSSIGNDPTWNDRGEDNPHMDYWRGYSFGDLSATAQTRKDVLKRLLPRLKIAERCELHGKFLIVRGDIRTYKIHLGSGNILMEPNDQYLCIVPSRRTTSARSFFLPFEGDSMMEVILSKAFLLVDDQNIKDRTITSQIRRDELD